jgi:site-specific DNA recombinase
MKKLPPKTVRCAIYTRVSTDQGLEQDFNSLDNQREAAEAYIKSQAHEGWRCLPAQYNDGGFSGATLERPALQKLLADVRTRLIDVVVVYKVDRITRSLVDFAKLVELFDQHEVSFVSVTQAFNTTTSMGRLTLNVLLSFAQFEREVTAERIRDKIAASKRKGMRMGGPVPLGYDVENKRLVINAEEAERVRLIFRRYLEFGSLTRLLVHLFNRRIYTKTTRLSDGRVRGGIVFTKGSVAYLLKNRVYVGEIVHKTQHYPGEHEPILDKALFEAVQEKLASQSRARRASRINNGSLLTGRIFDDRGNRMTPSSSKKGSARYRYYISAPLIQGRRETAGTVSRLPARDIEAAVLNAIKEHVRRTAASEEVAGFAGLTDCELIERYVDKIVVKQGAVEIIWVNQDGISQSAPLIVSWSPIPSTRRREIILPADGRVAPQRPIRSETRARLVEGIAKGRLWLEELVSGTARDTKEIAECEGYSDRSVRMTLSLAFLSPRIVQATVDGTLPEGQGVSGLIELPADWHKQMKILSARPYAPDSE